MNVSINNRYIYGYTGNVKGIRRKQEGKKERGKKEKCILVISRENSLHQNKGNKIFVHEARKFILCSQICTS